jgi:hypothetical protein
MGIGNLLGTSLAIGVTANITDKALSKVKKKNPEEYKKKNSKKLKDMDIMEL